MKCAMFVVGMVVAVVVCGSVQSASALIYQDGLNGYTGTRDDYIGGLHPRGDGEMTQNGSFSTLAMKYQNQPGYTPAGQYTQYRDVIKFVNLNLPITDPNEISYVKLHLNAKVWETEGTNVSVYGLLRNFVEGNGTGAEWNLAQPGVTWRYADWHDAGSVLWNTYGADATGTTAYDSTADRLAVADDTKSVNSTSGYFENWVAWDVTRSFKDQLANGKEYGWLVTGAGMAPNLGIYYAINFKSSEYSDPTLRPYLEVVYVPEPGTLAILALGALGTLLRRR